MRIVTTIAFLAALLTAVNTASAEEKKCTLIKATSVQMVRSPGDDRDVLPITIAGASKYFLFDTGGDVTQISRTAASDLHLPIFHGPMTLVGLTGTRSTDAVRIPEFDIGVLGRANTVFPVSPNLGTVPSEWFDGILALDRLQYYDTEVDFGSDIFNLFSPDHCPGGVVYWPAPAVAVLPIIKIESDGIEVGVTLDGQKFNAVLDTGSSTTTLRVDLAEKLFGLTMGSADAPAAGHLNGNQSFQEYRHTFKSLAFGDIAVNNPKMTILPGANFDLAPAMIIGMDVLRKLHVYFSFHEGKMYITPASVQTPEQKTLQASLQPVTALRTVYKLQMEARIAALDKTLSASPDDYKSLNDRCFFKATIKTDLDAALTDCNQSVKLKPDDPFELDSRAFVIYQQGKYQDALTAYDAVLAVDPKQPESLFMRGHAKGKLGDAAGMAADIAAAKSIKPDVEDEFKPYAVDL